MNRIFLIIFSIIGIVLSTTVRAQPELDATFSGDGKAVYSNWATSASAGHVLVQRDNKIILLSSGLCQNINMGTFSLCMVRLNENGSFDTSFGNNGAVFTQAPGRGSDLELQQDGKIIVVGGGENAFLARYNTNGTLDSSFGSAGIVTLSLPDAEDIARGVAVQPDGKIVVVGSSSCGCSVPTTSSQQFVARYSPNGMLDSTFGLNGIVTTTIPDHLTSGSSVTLQADGKILAGGGVMTMPGSPTPTTSGMLIRLSPDGSLDPTWDHDGIRTVVLTNSQLPTGFGSLEVEFNGRATTLGFGNLYRFNSDGSLDTGFDDDGSRLALPSPNLASSFTISGGKITVVGNTGNTGTTYQYVVARYLQNGSPDTGSQNIDVSGNMNDGALDVAADSLGRIVVSGHSAIGSPMFPFEWPSFSAVRIVAPAPAAFVGISGRVMRSDGRPVMNTVLTTQDGTGTTRTAHSNPFGYYRFLNLPGGQTYTISARSKGLVYTDRTVFANSDIFAFDFVGSPSEP